MRMDGWDDSLSVQNGHPVVRFFLFCVVLIFWQSDLAECVIKEKKDVELALGTQPVDLIRSLEKHSTVKMRRDRNACGDFLHSSHGHGTS